MTTTGLDEDGEENHDQGGRQEDVLHRIRFWQDRDQGESHRPPQAPVRHDELLPVRDALDPPRVDDVRQSEDSNESGCWKWSEVQIRGHTQETRRQ